MLHACFYTFCLLFRYTLWHFCAFSGTNLLTSRHNASSLFFAIFVFQKWYKGNILRIGRNKFLKSYFSWKLLEIWRGVEGGPLSRPKILSNFGGKFSLLFCLRWLKFHKDLKLFEFIWKLCLKTILNFQLFSWRTSLRKNKYQNTIFPSFIQTLISFMQACLQKIVLQSLLYSIKVAFQTIFECVSQSLFYKLLFYYFRKNQVQTLFLLFYASKANRLIWGPY
jgi:hypothetical protein